MKIMTTAAAAAIAFTPFSLAFGGVAQAEKPCVRHQWPQPRRRSMHSAYRPNRKEPGRMRGGGRLWANGGQCQPEHPRQRLPVQRNRQQRHRRRTRQRNRSMSRHQHRYQRGCSTSAGAACKGTIGAARPAAGFLPDRHGHMPVLCRVRHHTILGPPGWVVPCSESPGCSGPANPAPVGGSSSGSSCSSGSGSAAGGESGTAGIPRHSLRRRRMRVRRLTRDSGPDHRSAMQPGSGPAVRAD